MKKLILLLLVFTLLLSMTACSGAKKTTQQPSDKTTDTDAVVKIQTRLRPIPNRL